MEQKAESEKRAEDVGHTQVTEGAEDPEDPLEGFRRKYAVVVALLVRLVLLVHVLVAVWLVVSLTGNNLLWSLLGACLLLLLEAIYTVIKRGGHEGRWVCTCFLVYLAAVLPPIWMVELHRLQSFNDALDQGNLTSLVTVSGMTVPFKLEPNVWVSVMEQALLFLLVLCRWLLPRGDITRSELSQLLFVFMGIASDNMELFELFDETEVRKDHMLTLIVLGVWSLSLLQFVFVLTATRSPQKSQVIHLDEQQQSSRKRRRKRRSLAEVIFATEIWSLMFSVLVQDGPYAATRIYTLLTYNLITYSIIFFISKNLLVISLVLYRLVIICVVKHSDKEHGDQDDAASQVSSKSGQNGRLLMQQTGGSSNRGEPAHYQLAPLHNDTPPPSSFT